MSIDPTVYNFNLDEEYYFDDLPLATLLVRRSTGEVLFVIEVSNYYPGCVEVDGRLFVSLQKAKEYLNKILKLHYGLPKEKYIG
jgi:hypothetical protein